jgi:hypothetical protein
MFFSILLVVNANQCSAGASKKLPCGAVEGQILLWQLPARIHRASRDDVLCVNVELALLVLVEDE